MSLRFVSTLLLAFAASWALGDDSLNAQTIELLEVGRVMKNTIALFDTVNDPSWKCLYGTRPVYRPEQRLVVFVYHFPNMNTSGKEVSIPYCLNLTATDSGYFSFSRCDDPGDQELGQMLYFDGKSCYIGWFDISGTKLFLGIRHYVRWPLRLVWNLDGDDYGQ
ncbi:uncharacterized protein LOC144119355 isoform X2 [Amblyomma americanum]